MVEVWRGVKIEWVIEEEEEEEDGGGIDSREMVVEMDGGYSIGGWWVRW